MMGEVENVERGGKGESEKGDLESGPQLVAITLERAGAGSSETHDFRAEGASFVKAEGRAQLSIISGFRRNGNV